MTGTLRARPRVPEATHLILASGSRARREMLSAAGLTFEVVPSNLDEDAVRARLHAENPQATGADVALALAQEKARDVSSRSPGALVIGSDQVLELGTRQFQKPRTIGEASEHLQALRGREHALCCGVALSMGAEIVWSHLAVARMRMRSFSGAFLDTYLQRAGEHLLSSVGCYQLEGLGLQLFEAIDGDYFTILGMPLLPLLAELRNRGVIQT